MDKGEAAEVTLTMMALIVVAMQDDEITDLLTDENWRNEVRETKDFPVHRATSPGGREVQVSIRIGPETNGAGNVDLETIVRSEEIWCARVTESVSLVASVRGLELEDLANVTEIAARNCLNVSEFVISHLEETRFLTNLMARVATTKKMISQRTKETRHEH